MSDASTLSYAERRPEPRLLALVECFWTASDSLSRERRPPEHIVPDGCPELIVHLADRFSRRIDGRWRRQGRAFLAGTLSRPWSLRAGRVIDTFGIRFRPGALPAIVEVDMRSTVDREVPLAELVGARSAGRLVTALAAQSDLASRAAAAEVWLGELPARSKRGDTQSSLAAVAAIRASRGAVRVDEIAGRLGLSRRQLERRFARDLGIAPKLYARIVRLQAALLELGDDERAAGVDVALAAGFFDQSHLLRDFRGLAGRPARRARAADGEMARHFTAPERLLKLLEGE